MFKKIILSALLVLSTSLMANQSVSVTAVVDRADYADKSMPNLQKEAMQKAKLEAAAQLFGDFIKSETVVKDGSLVKDLILAEKGGIVHIEGNPEFANGQNLGELKVSIKAYATQKDIDDMKVSKIDLQGFVYTNPKLTLAQLKEEARKAFIIEAISQKKPSIKTESNAADLAEKLAVSVNIEKMDFNSDWMAYKINGNVEYIPIFLRSGDVDIKSLNMNSIIVKNNADLTVISAKHGISNLAILNEGKGFVFKKSILKKLKEIIVTDALSLTINAKLLIPDEITADILTVQVNGADYLVDSTYGDYVISINNKPMKKSSTVEANVINDGNKRYVNLSVYCTTNGYAGDSAMKDFSKLVIGNLASMNFSLIDENENLFSAHMVTLLPDTGASKGMFKANMSILTSKGYENYLVSNNGLGFIFYKKVFKKLKTSNDEKVAQTLTINARLLIPDEITADILTVQVNGADYLVDSTYGDYVISINNKPMKKSSTIETNVINDGNKRYVNLSVYCTTNGYAGDSAMKDFSKLVIGNLASMNFIVVSDDKLYATQMEVYDKKTDLKILLTTNKESKNLSVHTNGLGFIFDKKVFEKLKTSNDDNVAQTLTINARLLIPDEITADILTVQVNGADYLVDSTYGDYVISINNKPMKKSSTVEANVINDGNKRYVNLSVYCTTNGYAGDSAMKDFSKLVIGNLASMNFIVGKNDKFYKTTIFQ